MRTSMPSSRPALASGADVVGVADIGQGAPAERAERLAHGEHVRHRLAGVHGIGEEVDDGHVEPAAFEGAGHPEEHGVLEHTGAEHAVVAPPAYGRRPRRSRARPGPPRSPGCRRGAHPGRPPPSRWSCTSAPTASRRRGRRPGLPAPAGAAGPATAPGHAPSRPGRCRRCRRGWPSVAVPSLLSPTRRSWRRARRRWRRRGSRAPHRSRRRARAVAAPPGWRPAGRR